MRMRQLSGVLALLLLLAGCAGVKNAESPVNKPEPGQETKAGPAPAPPADKSAQVKPLPGYKAPSLAGRDVITGESIALSQYKGKVVMLNFWATWCIPCRDEMPAMEQFQKEAGENVKVIAMGATETESVEKMAAFVKELKLSFAIGYDGAEAADRYHVFGLPTSFFIDKNGVIRGSHSGPLTLEQMRKMADEAAKAS